ncbi:autoinducer binding domain-containing protein [Paracoccus litorisediminis]|uniref:autoinducer binding domain-containing protein n=1 Tax=Paracoccus litorisediminis TaxID=2006130 RepID=UPI0037312472
MHQARIEQRVVIGAQVEFIGQQPGLIRHDPVFRADRGHEGPIQWKDPDRARDQRQRGQRRVLDAFLSDHLRPLMRRS